jgi:signal transduction histidine kinase
MRLAAKFISVFLGIVIFILSVDAFVSVQRQRAIFERDMEQDSRLIGHTLSSVLVDIWRSSGERRAMEVLSDVNRSEHLIRVRWVWTDVDSNDPRAPRLSPEALKGSAGGQPVFHTDSKTGMYYAFFPVPGLGTGRGGIEISRTLSDLRRHDRITVVRTALVSALLIFVGAVLSAIAGLSLIGRPLSRILEHTKRMGAGDLSTLLDLNRRDELGQVATGLNVLSADLRDARERARVETEGRIAAIEEARHADRLRTVGQLASGIAHELGTPMNVVTGRAQLIADGGMSPQETLESAKIIKHETERMTAIVRQLLDFARRGAALRMRADLRHVLRRTVSLLEPLAQKRRVTILLEGLDRPAPVDVNEAQIQQVLSNVILNAVEASRAHGSVVVRLGEAGDPGDGDWIAVTVRDEGDGIPAEHIPRLFEPFFTTKEPGQGTGLGLSIAYGILEEHGGRITVDSTVGLGSVFTIRLPKKAER